MMLAATYQTTGSARDVLHVGEIDRPEPGPGEVRVRLRTSGVNPTDWKARSGATGRPLTVSFQIPNQDGAGLIDEVGEGVDRERLGEDVWVYFAAWQRPWGTAAQWSIVPSEQAVAMPPGVPDELGASLGIPALTAHRCLFADGPIKDRTVLVAAGAGAVGHAAIELARWAGARVVTTVSNEQKAELARAAGADAVVNYRADDAAHQITRFAPDGVDRIVEVSLTRNLELDLAVCRPNTTIATYASDSDVGDEVTVRVRALMAKNLTLRFVLIYSVSAAAIRLATSDVTEALRVGALTTLPLHRFNLEQIAEAHEAVQSGAVGKVIIDVP